MPGRIDFGNFNNSGRPARDRYGRPIGPQTQQPFNGMPAVPANWTLEQIANNLFQQTDPLRQDLIGQSQDFLSGGMDPTATPEYAAIRQYADQQANQARDSILETMPSGGTLMDKLADVDISKARTLTDASAGIYGDNMDRALTLASGFTQNAVGARAGADQLTAAREQADASRDAATKMAIGEGAGGIAGGYK
jgi:hypothetical protein